MLRRLLERARKFDEMTAKGSMKTRLDRELEQWIQIDDDERQKFIKSKISGYRSLFGDLVEIPRGYCIVS
ncbi:hypothetical protein M9Y10_041761 [Tritrichomonas musculus]|uniref:Uncharacterized protein n=1 Tax=Tritrichomonas musculus TaxID=1915356 RepID=A0ABR2K5H0_9EUKA